jgi:hypothetical protein
MDAVPRTLLAIDAPLGWPEPMGKALVGHVAGAPIEPTAHDLFRRATDRFVKARLGKQSLDVGADRIARTAHAALHLLADIRSITALPVPLAWAHTFSDRLAAIEVYPAVTLVAYDLPSSGYKKPRDGRVKAAIINLLRDLLSLPDDIVDMERSTDALDAGLCVLAGFDFLRGEAYAPQDLELALREGWIWVRQKHGVVCSTKI